ncbi:MAG: c-type cytochrome [Ramlibacter sp.]
MPARWTALVALAVLGLLGCSALVAQPPIERVATPGPQAFDRALVRRGEQLAAVGDCTGCHTVRGGPAYAGGVPLQTPFGTIHGTNITPDEQTGLGGWSEEAFRRAMRQGVSRDGHLLYPAFPYNHFTHLTDEDLHALYAFVMTRDAVRQSAPANRLMFPLQFRPLLAAWNTLYLKEGPVAPAAGQPPDYNHGLYLVDALGHCAACHSPRNRLGAEKDDADLAGGDAEGWHASALNAGSESPVPWTADALAAYLRSGLVDGHAMTAGPMHGVVASLARADPAHVQAIAGYIAARMGPPDATRQARAEAARRKAAQPLAAAQPTARGAAPDAAVLALGASVYQGSCAGCHDQGRGPSSDSALQMPLAIALFLPEPSNLVRIVREGIQPLPGQPGRWMPPFAGSLSDEQLTALVTWLRHQGTDLPPWNEVAQAVKAAGTEAP